MAIDRTNRTDGYGTAIRRSSLLANFASRQDDGRRFRVRYQIVIDCRDPRRLVRFWSSAIRYRPKPPPAGFPGWREYGRSLGVAEEEIRDVTSPESIDDPNGEGPRIWFHKVPEAKTGKNRLHFDIRASGSHETPLATRKDRVENEVARLLDLGAARRETLYEEGDNHYAVAMADPEGNEFDVN